MKDSRYQNPIELLTAAQGLTGYTLRELAEYFNIELPQDSLRAKGWVGQFIEYILGAEAGNKALPDFLSLGIELKTIPVDTKFKPLESTYLSRVPLTLVQGLVWEKTELYQKLAHILWVPILAEKHLSIGERKIGQSILWQPNPSEWGQLKMDWEEFMEAISLGRLSYISARQGEYLQIRPKGANSQDRVWGIGEEGERTRVSPFGFYLRAQFTKKILL